ncbi:hypothetical protein SOVF_007390 [Spinacia oleracea]|uniref:Methyltransferase domain-containing protein n=1 Tax=Spinacia oleracea TaxID=3562 RepID=A0A9R0JD82_SPIOL|nr:uncharacterized protein LOC110804418 [Spinacia oleracea]KNA25345.1 hypothetical protein SOVF_007390 [Spinacia oleracea]
MVREMTIFRYLLHPLLLAKPLISSTSSPFCTVFSLQNSPHFSFPINRRRQQYSHAFSVESRRLASSDSSSSTNVPTDSFPKFSELDDVLKGYMFGQKKATEVAHLVWKLVVQKGDTVVDATCGNGNDTVALAKLVVDDFAKGCVYGMDVQEDAIQNTSSLLNLSLDPNQRKCVKLYSICHSRMVDVIPENSSVRLVAFNLGYLPGGDKGIITNSATTLLALKAAKELLLPGGVISVVAYVGHPGGREEYETVQAFASELPAERWVCSQIQMLNKPLAPVLVFLFKR